jgi:exopolysaccharide production protein ExoQ
MSMELQSSAPPRGLERTYTIFVLVLMTGAFLNLFVTKGPNLEQEKGTIVAQVGWSLVYCVTLLLLFRHCRGFVRAFFREPLMVLLLVLAVVSTMWSGVPALTFRRSISLFCTSLFGLYLALRYSLRDQLKLLLVVCWITVVGSLIFGVFGLGTSVDNIKDAWYGLFVQKTALGRMMVLDIIVFLTLAKVNPRSRRLMWFGILLAFVLILLSQSRSSLIAALFLLPFALWCAPGLRGNPLRTIVVLAGLVCVGAVAAYSFLTHLKAATAFVGRDVTFTGRLYIWVLGTAMALRKPWLGYGYSAFWLGPSGPSGRIWSAMNWAAPNGHNGVLDLMLDLGIVGVGVFVLGFISCAWRVLATFRRTSRPEFVWPLLFLVFLVIGNLTQSMLVGGNGLGWMLYSSVIFGASLKRQKLASESSSATPAGRGHFGKPVSGRSTTASPSFRKSNSSLSSSQSPS